MVEKHQTTEQGVIPRPQECFWEDEWYYSSAIAVSFRKEQSCSGKPGGAKDFLTALSLAAWCHSEGSCVQTALRSNVISSCASPETQLRMEPAGLCLNAVGLSCCWSFQVQKRWDQLHVISQLSTRKKKIKVNYLSNYWRQCGCYSTIDCWGMPLPLGQLLTTVFPWHTGKSNILW